MDTRTHDTIGDLLAKARQVTIAIGDRPSLDSMAAALALMLSIEKAGKKAQVLCPTPPTVGLASLFGIDKVKTSNTGDSAGLIISLPYKPGAIEKISYDIVEDRIDLTIVPGSQGLQFTTEEITYRSPSASEDLLFAIGLASESLVPTNSHTPVVNIDNMLTNEGYGAVSFVDPSFSSHCEMIAKLLFSLSLPMDPDIAQNLLAGIIDKTKNFQSPTTSPAAFELAALLMQSGAQRGGISPIQAESVYLPESQWPGFPPQSSTSYRQKRVNQEVVQKVKPDTSAFALKQKGEDKLTVNAQSAPKDWFEPKIYKGSTQA